MGKQSRSKKKGSNNKGSRQTKKTTSDDPPTKNYTIQEIQQLPFAPHHVWKAVKFGQDASSALAIMDMTRTSYDMADVAMPMKFVSCPDPSQQSGRQEIVQAILNAMGQPTNPSGPNDPLIEYLSPRRPFTILVDPEFEEAFPFIKEQIEQVGDVGVEMYTDQNFSVTTTAAFYIPFLDNYTWRDVGFMDNDSLMRNVSQLPLRAETWTCGVFQDEDTSMPRFVVENTAAGPKGSMPMGMGMPFLPRLSHMALMCVMLTPMDESERRRPQIVIFQSSISKHFDFFRGMLMEVGVYAVLQSMDICSFCGKQPLKVSVCSRCKSVSYCDSNCQKRHWHRHKMECKKL